MVLAVGDGNHSLATAKPAGRSSSPRCRPRSARTIRPAYCLAEVCNVHSPAIEIEPIHRVVFGAQPRRWLPAWPPGPRTTASRRGAQGAQRFTLAGAGYEQALALSGATEPLTVGTIERFLGETLPGEPGWRVDYIHGEAAARALAADPPARLCALLLPPFDKADLFRGVVLGGVLPRKTFSMGHAEEKRYYNECRSLV